MAFQVIQPQHEQELQKIIPTLIHQPAGGEATEALSLLIDQIRDDIPKKKRISYGRYSVVRDLGSLVFDALEKKSAPIFEISSDIMDNGDVDYLVRGVFLQVMTLSALENLEQAWPYIEKTAAHEHWELREFASGYVRRLIKDSPEKVKKEYLRLVRSEDPLHRRFVAESLRPVQENRWFRKQPEYPFSILKHLFKEPKPYPRTAVGNNLSDWMRVDEEYAFEIVRELALNGDKNSHWIAYRACRNLVKKEPEKVMDLLGVDEYKYKDRFFSR